MLRRPPKKITVCPDSIVTASDVTYPGFVRTTTDLSLKVTADGKAVKYIYYDRNLAAQSTSTSGSELSPVIGKSRDPVPPSLIQHELVIPCWLGPNTMVLQTFAYHMPQEPITAKALELQQRITTLILFRIQITF